MTRTQGAPAPYYPKVESIVFPTQVQDYYMPGVPVTIVKTAEDVGLANADWARYCFNYYTLKSPDPRIVVKRVNNRLETTITSMTAGTLYCRAYIDVQDAAHRVLDLSWAAPAAAHQDSLDITSGTVFDLMTDGNPHTIYFFFWVDTGNAVLNPVHMRFGTCGTNGTSCNTDILFEVTHNGFIEVEFYQHQAGTPAPAIGHWAWWSNEYGIEPPGLYHYTLFMGASPEADSETQSTRCVVFGLIKGTISLGMRRTGGLASDVISVARIRVILYS